MFLESNSLVPVDTVCDERVLETITVMGLFTGFPVFFSSSFHTNKGNLSSGFAVFINCCFGSETLAKRVDHH